jgi:hypothetical protein
LTNNTTADTIKRISYLAVSIFTILKVTSVLYAHLMTWGIAARRVAAYEICPSTIWSTPTTGLNVVVVDVVVVDVVVVVVVVNGVIA